MSTPLRILHLEDLPADAEIIERELRKADIQFEKRLVSLKPEFLQALQEFKPDIILSDHSLPAFNSLEALRLAQKNGIDVPFILVTATVSEEYAVNMIQEGASDYVIKDHLQRLPNAMQNALEKHALRREQLRALAALRNSEQKYKLLFESNPLPMWMVSRRSHAILDVNPSALTHYGYTREEFTAMHAFHLWSEISDGMYRSGTWKHRKKDGTLLDVEIISREIIYAEQPALLILANDITEKLRAEAELARQVLSRQKLIAETSIQVQEKEREEIGKELHDNINQILAASKLCLDVVIREGSCAQPEVLQKCSGNLNLAIEEIRKLSQSLVAPSLEEYSLRQSIEKMIDNLPARERMQIQLEMAPDEEKNYPASIQLMIYRVIQEQMNNILKHAQASEVCISLSSTTEILELRIIDNGVGFPAKKKSGGIGLRNIKNRAGLYNGTVTIQSAPGQGCALMVTVPRNQDISF